MAPETMAYSADPLGCLQRSFVIQTPGLLGGPQGEKQLVYGRNRKTEVEKGVRQRRERRIDGKL